MGELVFAMELRGKAEPVGGSDSNLRAATQGQGPNQENVSFQSEVVVQPDGTFDEKGTIDYGGKGKVSFETVGAGHIEASPESGRQWGTVMWRVTRGEGAYQGASGFITSNFVVNDQGELVDNQYVRMILP